MPLLTIHDVTLELGDQLILRNANLTIEPGERVSLIGRNGAGKSTLLRLITGEQQPDSGEIRRAQAIRISQLAQALPDALEQTAREFVTGGLDHLATLVEKYRAQSQGQMNAAGLRELEDLQHHIEAEGGWHLEQRVDTILTELDLPADQRLHALSGGWQRRVGLARALVSNPELLLLDEPTNHLDLAAIEWLENRIRNYQGSVLFITHDRAFLQRLASRIVELDRARLSSWPGDYKNFMRRKEEASNADAIDQAEFEKKLAEEEVWIRQGIKARRSRNEGRVRALQGMRAEFIERQRFKAKPFAHIHIEQSEHESGRKIIELKNVTHGYGEERLIENLSLKIMRGDRIGLIGNNGVGKSTLLRIMLGRLAPQSGTVKLGTNLQIAYFDQMRRDLDPEKTIAETVSEGRDFIKLGGKDRHIIGYLRGFLFSATRAMTPIKALSGGERNRVILARLFTRPSNFLVLDEATNDLDIETLEVLEDRLIEYQGTLIVASHDREFLDNVITSTLVFEPGGQIRRYVGGFSDWARRNRYLAEKDDPKRVGSASRLSSQNDSDATNQTDANPPKKLSYKFRRELEQLPDQIEFLEHAVAALQRQIADPEFYAQPLEQVQPVLNRLKIKNEELEQAIERWAELEGRQLQ